MTDHPLQHPPYARWAHILLRLFAGALFAQHGAQKLFGVLQSPMTAPIGSQFWFAGIIEFFGGLLLILGLFTRPAAFIAAGEMAFAYFTVHIKQGFWPILNKGEPAILFCFTFLYFAATGAGAFSLDYLRSRRKIKPVMAS